MITPAARTPLRSCRTVVRTRPYPQILLKTLLFLHTVVGIPTKMAADIGPDLRSTHLARPHGCSIAPDGRLVIADSDDDRILTGDVPE